MELHDAVVQDVLTVVDEPNNYHYVIPLVTGTCTTEPVALEPEKCEKWFWHDWSKPLPEPVMAGLAQAKAKGINPFAR